MNSNIFPVAYETGAKTSTGNARDASEPSQVASGSSTFPLLITTASEKHIPEIAELEKICFSVPYTEEQLRNQLNPDSFIFLVAEDESGVAGYVGLQYVLDEGYVTNIAVSPNSRRRGIARQLMNALRVECEKPGLAFITLEVRVGNEPAIELYKSLGYIQTGLRKNYYEKPREDALIYTLNLKSA